MKDSCNINPRLDSMRITESVRGSG